MELDTWNIAQLRQRVAELTRALGCAKRVSLSDVALWLCLVDETAQKAFCETDFEGTQRDVFRAIVEYRATREPPPLLMRWKRERWGIEGTSNGPLDAIMGTVREETARRERLRVATEALMKEWKR